jgi:hypothetical protein
VTCPRAASRDAELYTVGTTVILTPTPDASSFFFFWGGDADCLDGQVTMTANLSCSANFELTSSLLFRDGFESNDTSAWSSSVP